MNAIKRLILIGCLILPGFTSAQQPNVLIIVSDDQGWNDVGFNGGTDIPTPHLDALAADGVVFGQGYASHPYCSPSRAGLLSGRYQQRFGHENNIPYESATDDDGLPLSELMLSEYLVEKGYSTAAIGKWHLGDHEKFWPINRGFEHWFGFFGGGLNYWGDTGNKPENHGVLRDGQIVPKEQLSYLTDDFTQEAARYIDQFSNDQRPFFMYLAYNAPHAPIQAPSKYLDKVNHIEDGDRAAYAAMVTGMDEGIGRVIQKLKDTGQYENTLIFFYSDNGGHLHGASNAPFRGHKGMLFEGGIRVPFLVTWPAGIQGGQHYDHPISALDIFPTVLAAADISSPSKPLDGVNLLPFLTGQEQKPQRMLYWRYSDGAGYAVRDGNYKLVYSGYKEDYFLFDLEEDPYEQQDIKAIFPEKTQLLKDSYANWNEGTVPAMWQDPHAENVLKEEAQRQRIIDKAKSGER
ncbi:N-acetylgalactosamine-6-sulfatase [Echinicola strongylocentroti]|uniref:N-acetylgalactosamine-6-sulfatase n=1 Tax=Echinicola strongylocentroti TaxID=1795355 RepID=A0A2Z4IQQ3_9BACT|nr:sulfatase-like hydrolase/transferase [Echinicola strongylocentroti]AWW33059.1 N-acetylgalactosamine-6-sulfatase [Echinicola strongylocentroti]